MSVFRDNQVDHNFGDYRCPKCSNPIVWSLRNGRPGSKAAANCTKHYTQARINFDVKKDYICTWQGIVKRTKSGSVEFFDSDGKTRLRKR